MPGVERTRKKSGVVELHKAEDTTKVKVPWEENLGEIHMQSKLHILSLPVSSTGVTTEKDI